MFDLKEYRKRYYEKNREYISLKGKEKYLKNKEKIKDRVKERILKETKEEREKRLSFHKKYNKDNRERNKELQQSDIYKYKQYKFSAKRRNYGFELLYEDFIRLFHEKCYYCGTEDSRGIDRIDNNVGYVESNSVPCCEMCNKMKWKWNKQDFINHIKNIYNNLI
jgi:hypothetical protein